MYLRGVSPIQQRQVLEDVEQDLLWQTLPADSLPLTIFLPALLAGPFKSLLSPTAGATSVLLLIPLETSFHPGYTEEEFTKSRLMGRINIKGKETLDLFMHGRLNVIPL